MTDLTTKPRGVGGDLTTKPRGLVGGEFPVFALLMTHRPGFDWSQVLRSSRFLLRLGFFQSLPAELNSHRYIPLFPCRIPSKRVDQSLVAGMTSQHLKVHRHLAPSNPTGSFVLDGGASAPRPP